MRDTFIAPLEVKFAAEASGEFEGYGAVFGNVDSHGDMIVPGAFAASLAQHKARGGLPTMYAQHGPALGGDVLPVGVWTEMEEDARGLRVKGRISALDTDHGRRIRALVKDGALKGLSIGYRVPSNGAVYGKKPSEPRRTLKSLNLIEVSIVDVASNDLARVESIKSRLADGEVPTLREVEEALREQFGLTRTQAAAFAAGGYKSLIARESGDGEATPPEAKAAMADLRQSLAGFTLPSFR
jgi:HK97 family phage prohead protease